MTTATATAAATPPPAASRYPTVSTNKIQRQMFARTKSICSSPIQRCGFSHFFFCSICRKLYLHHTTMNRILMYRVVMLSNTYVYVISHYKRLRFFNASNRLLSPVKLCTLCGARCQCHVFIYLGIFFLSSSSIFIFVVLHSCILFFAFIQIHRSKYKYKIFHPISVMRQINNGIILLFYYYIIIWNEHQLKCIYGRLVRFC